MKRLSLVLIAALLATVALCGDAWHSYRSSDGTYSVDFPGKPITQKKHENVQGYNVPMDITAYGNNGSGYAVVRMHLGDTIPGVRGREAEVLSYGFAGFTQGKGYRILSQESFQMNGHPGRHAVLHKNGIEEQVYAVGKDGQMILILVAGRPGKTVSQASKRFIASFKLH